MFFNKFFRKGGAKNHQASSQEPSAVPNGTSCESSEYLTTSDLMTQITAFNPDAELTTIDGITAADHGRMVISAREMNLVSRAVVHVDHNNHNK